MFDYPRKKKNYPPHKPTTKNKVTPTAKKKKLAPDLKYSSSTKNDSLLPQTPQWQNDMPLEHDHIKKYNNSASNPLYIAFGLAQLLAYTTSTTASPINVNATNFTIGNNITEEKHHSVFNVNSTSSLLLHSPYNTNLHLQPNRISAYSKLKTKKPSINKQKGVEPEDTLETINDLITISPKNAQLFNRKSIFLEKQGDHDGALVAINKAITYES